MQHYGGNKLYFILHPFPLTMHRQAWDAAQVRHVNRFYFENDGYLLLTSSLEMINPTP